MKAFLLSRPGAIASALFALGMAFLFHHVLQRQAARERTRQEALKTPPPVTKIGGSAETLPQSLPLDSSPKPVSGGVAPATNLEMSSLDRYQKMASLSRTDRDRQGRTLTRRRTSKAGTEVRASKETVLGSAPKGLRLSGRGTGGTEEAVVGPGIESPGVSPKEARVPDPNRDASDPDFCFVPYGRPLVCELVFTIDSTLEETPLVGLVVEPVYNNGLLVIPAGTELHGVARPDRLRDRVFSGREWVLVFPREQDKPNGRHLRVQGLALDRELGSVPGQTWGLEDGSAGLRGSVIRTLESEEIKRFISVFVSAGALTLQEREGAGRGSSRLSNSPRNAALQGASSTLEDLAKRLSDEIKEHGVYLRVPGGKPFYFYPLEAIHPSQAFTPPHKPAAPAQAPVQKAIP